MRALARILTAAAAVALAALPAPAQWSTVGGDQGNTRYSSLSQINAQNISKLGAAWISDKIGPPPSSRAMPVIDAGLLFVTAPPFVTAVNLADGKIA
jgi:glucose dehydrogenase